MKTVNNNLYTNAGTACVLDLSAQDLRVISGGGHETEGHDASTDGAAGHGMGDYVNLFGESAAYVVGYFFAAGPTLIVQALTFLRFFK